MPSSGKNLFAEIVVPLPLHKTFTYKIPAFLMDLVTPGVRAYVPFGKRNMTGVIVSIQKTSDFENPHQILDVIDESPLFSSKDLLFARKGARHYGVSMGEMIRTMVPPGFFREEKVRFQLTEEGSGTDDALLHIFSRDRGVSRRFAEKELRKRGVKGPRATIARFQREGLIRVLYEVQKEAEAKTESIIEMEDADRDGIRITPAANKLLLALEKGPLEKSALLNQAGVSRSVLNRLVESGLLREVKVKSLLDGNEQALEEEIIDFEHTSHQVEALAQIGERVNKGEHSIFLLHGVTGSGKTEVYLGAIEKALSRGRGAIYLIPEIALTPLLLGRIKRRFGENIALLHSKISTSVRHALWERLKRGETRVAIGARSAIFAPIPDLGVIIVDEEHDQAYKQDDGLKYNGRDLALIKGEIHSAPVIFGSATPSAESYFKAKTGMYNYLVLPERVAQSHLPRVEIVDLSQSRGKRGFKRFITEELEESIGETLDRGETGLLFINRRGFSPWLLCLDCGRVEKCDNCSVSLTQHREEEALICHYCGARKEIPATCPRCNGPKLASAGIGTEKLLSFISKKWKEARIARMDSDAMRKKGAYGALLKQMNEGEIDILIGTQMIAKGHDFPQVTLVGVVMADLSLTFPDFRSSERTYQTLTQVAGRAGRRKVPGRVIVQTFQPDNYAIQCAANHDYKQFMDIELGFRSELSYPPFSRLLLIRVWGGKKNPAQRRAREVVEMLYERFEKNTGLMILGPSPAPIWKMKKQFIFQILVKSHPDADFSHLMESVNHEFSKRKGGVSIAFDVDPYQLMY